MDVLKKICRHIVDIIRIHADLMSRTMADTTEESHWQFIDFHTLTVHMNENQRQPESMEIYIQKSQNM